MVAGAAFASLLVYEVLNWSGDASLTALLATSFGLIVVLTLWALPDLPLHHPLMLVMANVFVGVCIRGLFIRFRADEMDIQQTFILDASMGDFATTLVLLLLLLPLFMLGYILVGKVSPRLPVIGEWEWSDRRYHVLEVVFVILAIAGIVSFIQKMGIAGVLTSLNEISAKRRFMVDGEAAALGYQRLAAKSALVLYFVTVIRVLRARGLGHPTPITDWVRLPVYFLLAAALPFITSSRSLVLFAIVNTVLLISLHGRFRLQTLVVYGAAGLLVFNVMSLLRNTQLLSGEDDRFAIIEVLNPLLENRNLFDLSKTTHILNAVPERVPYMWGSTLLTVFYAPVPRTIWPEKPEINVGRMVATEVYGIGYHLRTGVPPGLIGEFHLNFGYPGTALAALLYGMIVRLLWNLLRGAHARGRPNYTLVYILFLLPVSITMLGSSLQQSIIDLLQVSALAGLAAWILREPTR